MPSARSFLSSFWWLCLSSVCSAPSFSCPGFTVISLVLLLSLLVVALSFCLLALLFVLFLGLSSLFLAVSFLLLPRLPLLLFLPLLCLSVGASWYVCSWGFVNVCAYCFLVLYCGCCLFVFLLVFTSCYLFVVLFSSWRGFAGGLWCWRMLSFSYFTGFHLYSMMVPPLTAGSEYPVGGGGGGYSPVHLICSLPSSPLSPTTAVDLRSEGWVGVVPELPACRCQTYVTGSKGIPHWESGKNV